MGVWRLSEMRRIYLPLLVMALVFGTLPLVQPTQVYAAPDTETLRPDGGGDYTEWDLNGPSNYGATSDESTSTDIYTGIEGEKELMNIQNHSAGSGTINSVTIWFEGQVFNSGGGPERVATYIKTNANYYTGGNNTMVGEPAWDQYSEEYTDNPQTTTAWIWAEIDGLQAGVITTSHDGDEIIHVSEVWVVVDYTPPPTVTDTSPIKGTTDDTALVVTINGASFVSGGLAAEINFDTADPIAGASVTFVSSTEITATFDLSGVTTNLGAAWDVKVTNPDAQPGTGDNLFTIYRPDPTVSAITPDTGEDTGSVNITDLAGTNFVDGFTSVKLAKGVEPDINGTSVVVESTTKITVTFDLTGVAPGDWDVVVTVTGAESSATLAAGFDITTSAAPSIINDSDTGNSYGFGSVAEGSTTGTGLSYFTVTNNSSYAINITISAGNMTGGITWTLADNPAADIYALRAGTPGAGDYTTTVTSGGTLFISNLAGLGSTQDWGLQFLAPTSFGDGISKSGTVTLTATAVV